MTEVQRASTCSALKTSKKSFKNRSPLRTVYYLSFLQWMARSAGVHREAAIASLLGTGGESSLFILAEKVPRLLQGVFFDGLCLQLAFPNLSKHRKRIQMGQAGDLEVNFLAVLMLIFSIAFLGAWMLAPLLVAFLGPGWLWEHWVQGPQRHLFEQAIALVRGLLPGFWGMTLACYLGLGLNLRGFYLSTALLPYLLNCVVTFFARSQLSWAPLDKLVFGYNTACFGALLVQLVFSSLKGVPCLPKAKDFSLRRAGIQRLFRWMPAVLLGAVSTQLAALLPTFMATFFYPKAMSQLHYAWRTAEFLLGSLRAGLLTVLPPILAESFKEGQSEPQPSTTAFQAWLRWGFLTLAFWTLPLALWGGFSARALIHLIYGGSTVAASELEVIHRLFQCYLLTWCLQGFVRLFSLASFAAHEVSAPIGANLTAAVFQLGLSAGAAALGHLWLVSFASALAAAWELWVLQRTLRAKSLHLPFKSVRHPLLGIVLASLGAVGGVQLGKQALGLTGWGWPMGKLMGWLLELATLSGLYTLIARVLGLKKADILDPPIAEGGGAHKCRRLFSSPLDPSVRLD